MSEVIRFRKEFLPHLIRLFSSETQNVDAQLNYFQQQFAVYQTAPEQSCLMVKGQDKLLACAYLVPLEVQQNLIYVHLAVDKGLDLETCGSFWGQCVELAMTLVSGKPLLRTAVTGEIPSFLVQAGFRQVREQVELHATLGHLPPVQAGAEDFHIVSLAESPEQEGNWLNVFNQGLTVFWDIPPMDRKSMERMRSAPGFDGSNFRLGLDGEEPVTALYCSVLDSRRGTVRINAAATSPGKRSRGFGRRMIKETLNYLEGAGMQEATIYTETANQATNLLYKMLGFAPKSKIRVLECNVVSATQPALSESAAAAEETSENKDSPGFYPGFHSLLNGKKK